jgi:hypothetical protein
MMTEHHQVPWLDIALRAEWMVNKGLETLETTTVGSVLCIFTLTNGAPLPSLLKLTSPMEASDSRDRIYALLGFYLTWLKKKGENRPFILPDYGKNVVEVYADVVRYLISLLKRDAHAGRSH